MSEIVVAGDDLRTPDETTVREAAQDIHGEDIEFLGDRSPFESTDDQPTLDEWST